MTSDFEFSTGLSKNKRIIKSLSTHEEIICEILIHFDFDLSLLSINVYLFFGPPFFDFLDLSVLGNRGADLFGKWPILNT